MEGGGGDWKERGRKRDRQTERGILRKAEQERQTWGGGGGGNEERLRRKEVFL